MEKYIDALIRANEIYASLITNKFSRDSPTNASKLEARIRESLINNNPIKFMGLWGGSKEGVCGDDADKKSLDWITAMQDHLRKYELPIKFTLLFCDMHHVLVNGRSYEETMEYYSSLCPLVQKRRLGIIRLSDLLGVGDIKHYTDIDSRIKAGEVINYPDFFEKLKEAARKHSKLGKFGIEYIARIYVEVEIYFLQRVDELCPNQIFFSFSDPTIQKPIAEVVQIPMLYLHSAGKGHHECPWYSGGQGD